MKKFLLLLLVVMASACDVPQPIRTVASGNERVDVALLAEFDGIRLYRVGLRDERDVYVAVAASEIRAQWMEPHGKTSVPVEVLTVREPR